ncbi:MAG: tetrahydromethanopterin S-methyltransferase subunit A [Nanoarchaeota archaeon]|nr:tetrahydromethanopterin S-methyltransferase subunit A [Nanoarchaeota archaeon]
MPKKIDANGWPALPGFYTVGDPKSCVAVCTLKEVDMVLPVAKAAITGRCLTENVGIERVIKNLISNPNIRFLILCGTEPKGHFVGQAFKCIRDNGVKDGNIIGAAGAMPYLKNTSQEEIARFNRQIELVDLIEIIDVKKIEEAIDGCIARDPGFFEDGQKIEMKQIETIPANFDREKIELDKAGWFLISIDAAKKEIVAEHYIGYGAEAKAHCRIAGKTAEEMAGTIAKLGLVSDLYHAAYLGKELEKAEIALKTGKQYEQDKPLEL